MIKESVSEPQGTGPVLGKQCIHVVSTTAEEASWLGQSRRRACQLWSMKPVGSQWHGEMLGPNLWRDR